MACADAVHAVQVAEFGPLAPKRIDTWPDGQVDDGRGMKNGEMRARPALEERPVLALDRGEPADARGDEHADARRRSPA